MGNVDWSGVAHPPAGAAARIACLVPSLTELLFALGCGDHVVARTGFCIHPREARRVAKIGGTKDPDLARLRGLAPTHVVVNVDENRREDVDAMRDFIPHIIVTHPMTPRENPRLYTLFGAIFGQVDRAAALSAQFHAVLEAATTAVRVLPREPVLYLIWKKPWMTVSRDTYVSASLAEVGWDTLPCQPAKRYPALEDDDVAWREASRILLSTEPYAFRERDAAEMKERHGKPVTLVDGEWTSWYGPRAIAGLTSLAELRTNIQS